MTSRVGRRRALAASGALALSSAILTACGGKEESGPADKSGLLSSRVDESGGGVTGGTFVTAGASTSGNLDPHSQASTAAFADAFNIFSTPLKWGRGVGQMPSPTSITGDAFESWEVTPDGMQISLRLRPNHTFDQRPPTNGRAMTIDDVKWSWDRSAANSPVMAEVLNSKGPAGPIESLSTPDSRTAVIKMAFPYGAITEL